MFVTTLVSIVESIVTVVFLNHIPRSWLAEYGEPGPDTGQKNRFSMLFFSLCSAVFFLFCNGMVFYRQGEFASDTLSLFGMLWVLWMILMADGKYGIIPDQFTSAFLLAGSLWNAFHLSFAGALLFGGFSFFLCKVSERKCGQAWMGFGDVKLLTVVGAVFGTGASFQIVCLSSLLTGLFAAIMLLFRKIKKDDGIPYGPFLAVSGSVILILHG